jgi:hypothetical protein
MVDGLSRRRRLHSILGYTSPMAFEKNKLAEERKLVA